MTYQLKSGNSPKLETCPLLQFSSDFKTGTRYSLHLPLCLIHKWKYDHNTSNWKPVSQWRDRHTLTILRTAFWSASVLHTEKKSYIWSVNC